jgi:hypothetical protein
VARHKGCTLILLYILFAPVLALVIYQIWVSRLLAKAAEYDAEQKRWQLMAIWGLPLLGAVLVHAIIVSTRKALPDIAPSELAGTHQEPGLTDLLDHR